MSSIHLRGYRFQMKYAGGFCKPAPCEPKPISLLVLLLLFICLDDAGLCGMLVYVCGLCFLVFLTNFNLKVFGKYSLIYHRLFHSLGFRCGLAGKQSTCNVGDLGSIPGLGRSPGEGTGYPFQYSGLENSPRVGHKLSNFHFHSLLS